MISRDQRIPHPRGPAQRPCPRLRPGNPRRDVTYYAQSRENSKYPCKLATFSQNAANCARCHLNAIQALDDANHGREVLVSETASDAGPVELLREAGERERAARGAGLVQ